MIVVYHKNNEVVDVFDYENNKKLSFVGKTIQETLIFIAKDNKTQIIGWCHNSLREDIDLPEWEFIFKHQLIMTSFETTNHLFINPSIGFVEDSPFINVNKKVNYPTWLMSADVGGIHASVLVKFEFLLKYKLSFSYFLNSVAKVGIKQGLLCYSNPKLLRKIFSPIKFLKMNISKAEMFRFIKSNYRFRWIFLYLINLLIYKKKIYIFSFLKVLFKESITNTISLKDILLVEKNEIQTPTIDVLIPTLGRANHLKNVLIDLSEQTLLPTKVIIVEQNLNINKNSELDFLSDKWPFKIDYTLINQLGACNARNIALSKVTSNWVFFADDDIRLNNKVLEDVFKYINLYNAEAATISCLQKNEIEKNKIIHQWPTFGSGSSIVSSNSLKRVKFNLAYEFGYGEDADFGMQLRNIGMDVLYIPFVKMLHLKAPSGGFREKIIQKWEQEAIKPKPSPTIMVYKLTYLTKEQLQSYKTTLFIKFYRDQSIKNPISYFRMMKRAWNKSIYWAKYLIDKYKDEI